MLSVQGFESLESEQLNAKIFSERISNVDWKQRRCEVLLLYQRRMNPPIVLGRSTDGRLMAKPIAARR